MPREGVPKDTMCISVAPSQPGAVWKIYGRVARTLCDSWPNSARGAGVLRNAPLGKSQKACPACGASD